MFTGAGALSGPDIWAGGANGTVFEAVPWARTHLALRGRSPA
jgi:hypothetical protein